MSKRISVILVAVFIAGFTTPSTVGVVHAQGIPTESNLKVAFIGDSGVGSSFQSVLDLIAREPGVDLVLHQGDNSYSSGSVSQWKNQITSTINNPLNIPYLGSEGNHDADYWGTYADFYQAQMSTYSIPGTDPHTDEYEAEYKGLKMVFTGNESGEATSHINSVLSGDNHVWKICSWHKNQTHTTPGPKGNDYTNSAFEACRQQGALVVNGHAHVYGRSKTISSFAGASSSAGLTVDSSCSRNNHSCVAPGKTVVIDSSLGGKKRSLDCGEVSNPWWAAAYGGNGQLADLNDDEIHEIDNCGSGSGTVGALFITFNVGGDPNLARGVFKNVNNQIIDEFELTRSGTFGPTPTTGPSPTPTRTPTPTPTLPPGTPSPTPPSGCYTSSSSWQNFSMSNQTGSFTVEYDATPNGSGIDALTMLSQGAGSAWSDYAALVRFNPSGGIDARNGGSYSADTTINYSANTTYHFRLEMDVPAKRYSVYVTPPGSSPQLLANNYAFRSEQSGVTSINNWGLRGAAGSHRVCNFQLGGGAGGTPTPTPPTTVSAKGILAGYGTTISILDQFVDGLVNILDWLEFLNPGTQPSPTPTGSQPTATPTPTPGTGACGDGTCNGPSVETCSNCSADCGPCDLRSYNRTICNSNNPNISKTTRIPIDNPWLPLPVGMVNELSDGSFNVKFSVFDPSDPDPLVQDAYSKAVVDGVPTWVIEERESSNGTLVECSYNYFVQGLDGTVCYYGEEVTNCSGGMLGGGWRAGDTCPDGSRDYAGIMMPANPTLDMRWIIEDADCSGPHEDALADSIIPSFTTHGGAYTFTNALYVIEDGGASNKTYAIDVGMVGDESISLISSTLLP